MAVPIAVAVLIFGIVSAIMSIMGLKLGAKLGTAAGEHGEVAAGVILIGVAGALAAGWLLPGLGRRQVTARPTLTTAAR